MGESRLLEEGIEDMQNLVTTDLVSLMLHTRIPLGRLVDWIDQSILYLRLPPGNKGESDERSALRLYGVRTATGLLAAWGDSAGDIPDTGLLGEGSEDTAIRIETIITTLGTEPNLHHVRAWKGVSS